MGQKKEVYEMMGHHQNLTLMCCSCETLTLAYQCPLPLFWGSHQNCCLHYSLWHQRKMTAFCCGRELCTHSVCLQISPAKHCDNNHYISLSQFMIVDRNIRSVIQYYHGFSCLCLKPVCFILCAHESLRFLRSYCGLSSN
ncbi:hypothetical protein V8G54_001678 [Vigna mungo]|uniref:Uncharacterized protein n=1 Tax=Vigna mungo TaxID=3915 RepID=A0AAQ3SC20_VIGMU